MNKEDIVGKKFGRLTVLRVVPTPDNIKARDHVYYECECDCPDHNKKIVYRSHLLSGAITSCGCYMKEQISKFNTNTKKKHNNYDLDSEDYGIGYDSKGNRFIFDKEDYESIKNYYWVANPGGYFVTTVHYSDHTKKTFYMHKMIFENTEGIIDHINGNPSDNRKQNLRPASVQQNSMNRVIYSNNTSGVSGVNYDKTINKWIARIGYKMKRINLGTFSKYEDAVNARKEAEKRLYGTWSRNCI